MKSVKSVYKVKSPWMLSALAAVMLIIGAGVVGYEWYQGVQIQKQQKVQQEQLQAQQQQEQVRIERERQEQESVKQQQSAVNFVQMPPLQLGITPKVIPSWERSKIAMYEGPARDWLRWEQWQEQMSQKATWSPSTQQLATNKPNQRGKNQTPVAPDASCEPQKVGWEGAGGARCEATIGQAVSSGGLLSIHNSAAFVVGRAQFGCAKGSWINTGAQDCQPLRCQKQPITWGPMAHTQEGGKEGVSCSGYLPDAPEGIAVSLPFTNKTLKGQLSAVCTQQGWRQLGQAVCAAREVPTTTALPKVSDTVKP